MKPHVGVTAAIVCLAIAACAGPATVPVPASLDPAAGEALAVEVAAKGVQIYECRAKGGGAQGYEWAFVAPDAELFDARERRVGHHGAGPHWEALDGSRIDGVVKARADAPVARAIPWLLLTARSTGPAGTFSRVTSVQRVDTLGGIAPSKPCEAANVGEPARVPYMATYRLFAPKA